VYPSLVAVHRPNHTAYRAAIIGTGRIGSLLERDTLRAKPSTHAGAYAAHPRVELVAGAEVDAGRLAEFGADWGIPSDHLYSDYRELLVRERPDLVSICAYAPDRVEMARAAIEAGARGLWLEKAVAGSMAEAASLRALAEGAGVAIVVNHTRRADPAWRRVAETVASAELGYLESVHCLFSGHFLHTGTHAWDLLDEWCGPWVSVRCWAEAQGEQARGRRTAEARARTARPSAAPGIHVDETSGWSAVPRVDRDAVSNSRRPDTREPEPDAPVPDPGARNVEPIADPGGVAHICFGNGVHAFVSGSPKSYFIFQCDLVFTAGRIQIGNDVRRVYRPAPSPRYEGFIELEETGEPLTGAAQPSLLETLLTGMETGHARLDSLDAAIRALNLGLAVIRASATPGQAMSPLDLPFDFYVSSV
jgi:Oxidoreductase family, NAD-binding Rossmann fold